jgi:SAM-dependent methyltransferase
MADRDDEPHGTNAEHWEARYAASDRVWSGNANALLVEHAASLQPGRALELGCGEGADAIWLARHGWQVLATDVAQSALDRGAVHASEAGVGESIAWERHDLPGSFPDGAFELVTAAYLHSRLELPREQILLRAAQAVAPGGHLLVIAHAGRPPWAAGEPNAPDLPDAAATTRLLALGADWVVELAEDVDVPRTAPDGTATTRQDCVVLARRLG